MSERRIVHLREGPASPISLTLVSKQPELLHSGGKVAALFVTRKQSVFCAPPCR